MNILHCLIYYVICTDIANDNYKDDYRSSNYYEDDCRVVDQHDLDYNVMRNKKWIISKS